MFNIKQVGIISSNSFAANRWQTITWTYADLVHRRIYAAIGGRVNYITRQDLVFLFGFFSWQQSHICTLTRRVIDYYYNRVGDAVSISIGIMHEKSFIGFFMMHGH